MSRTSLCLTCLRVVCLSVPVWFPNSVQALPFFSYRLLVIGPPAGYFPYTLNYLSYTPRWVKFWTPTMCKRTPQDIHGPQLRSHWVKVWFFIILEVTREGNVLGFLSNAVNLVFLSLLRLWACIDPFEEVWPQSRGFWKECLGLCVPRNTLLHPTGVVFLSLLHPWACLYLEFQVWLKSSVLKGVSWGSRGVLCVLFFSPRLIVPRKTRSGVLFIVLFVDLAFPPFPSLFQSLPYSSVLTETWLSLFSSLSSPDPLFIPYYQYKSY